jgi:hypothetical protein
VLSAAGSECDEHSHAADIDATSWQVRKQVEQFWSSLDGA